eukprot:4876657-Pleurochrysis_carterae.AAC.5
MSKVIRFGSEAVNPRCVRFSARAPTAITDAPPQTTRLQSGESNPAPTRREEDCSRCPGQGVPVTEDVRSRAGGGWSQQRTADAGGRPECLRRSTALPTPAQWRRKGA